VVVPDGDDGGPTGDEVAAVPAAPAASDDGGVRIDAPGDDEVALPSAEWMFSDGRAIVSPPAPGDTDTRPLWLAALLGLGAGAILTLTASVVVNNLNHAHPE